ncbi:hypothetical protein D3C73_1302670 [compost metagenome]
MEYIAPSSTANTVTLIPPPVEPGAAPMNMSIISKNWVEFSMSAMLSVLTPPDLELTE